METKSRASLAYKGLREIPREFLNRLREMQVDELDLSHTLYVISQLPKLKVLDDTAVKVEERELAAMTYERRRSRRDNNNSKP